VHGSPELNVVQGAKFEPRRVRGYRSLDMVHGAMNDECLKRRDAREAEGARLEIVYPANHGIEGSATEGRRRERSPAPQDVQGEASEHIPLSRREPIREVID